MPVLNLHLNFCFYRGEMAERIKKEKFEEYFEQDGFVYSVKWVAPLDEKVATKPELPVEDAIQIALAKQPLEEFCRYELGFYNIIGSLRLCWKLYGKRYEAYINALDGDILDMYDKFYR